MQISVYDTTMNKMWSLYCLANPNKYINKLNYWHCKNNVYFLGNRKVNISITMNWFIILYRILPVTCVCNIKEGIMQYTASVSNRNISHFLSYHILVNMKVKKPPKSKWKTGEHWPRWLKQTVNGWQIQFGLSRQLDK